MNNSHLIRFYSGIAYDTEGRTFDGVLSLSDEKLETTHNFIQWLFPLPEPSAYYEKAPVLTKEDIEAFKSNKDKIQDNMFISFYRMLVFYGFELYYEDIENDKASSPIVAKMGFAKRSKNWLTPFNHNFLRISRILRSLTLCGLKEEAKAFLKMLKKVYEDNKNIIPKTTMNFWEDAVK